MEQYKKEITKLFDKMTKDDQVELHGRIVRGDVHARNKVIENCLPLAYKIADNYHVNISILTLRIFSKRLIWL